MLLSKLNLHTSYMNSCNKAFGLLTLIGNTKLVMHTKLELILQIINNLLGGVHKGRPQKMTHFIPPLPLVRRCPHLTNPYPHCGRPHLASYTVLWSDSVMAGAVKIRCSLISSSGHFTPTPCGLICGSCN